MDTYYVSICAAVRVVVGSLFAVFALGLVRSPALRCQYHHRRQPGEIRRVIWCLPK